MQSLNSNPLARACAGVHHVLVALLLGTVLQAAAEPLKTRPYPLCGYWLFGRADAAAWSNTLARIGSLGADTVIQFGVRLSRKSAEDLRAHPLFSRCPFADAEANIPPRHLYTFETQERFGPALLADPSRDRFIDLGDSLVWRLVLQAPAGSQAPSNAPPVYDIVYLSGRKNDSVAALLNAASARGAHVYAGLPCAPTDPRYPWDPDLAALPVLEELTRRILADYAERYRAQPSFAGVYQSQETPVSKNCLPRVLAVYRSQHALVRSLLPGKAILVSPYWDARKNNLNGTDLASVRAGIRLLARQNVDIIAPQDSRGTGKVGLFWPDQAAAPVDSRLEPAVGPAAYGDAYHATTTDLYRTAREALDEAAAQEGLRVALWANIEAFEPGRKESGSSSIQRTTHERLDQAIMFAGIHPSKLICFMWDNYFTTRGKQALSLGDELAACERRPIVVQVLPLKAAGVTGLLVRGYHMEDTRAEIAFADVKGQQQTVSLPVEGLPHSVRPDVAYPLPARLQTAWVTFDTARLSDASRAELTLIRERARSFHPYRFTRE